MITSLLILAQWAVNPVLPEVVGAPNQFYEREACLSEDLDNDGLKDVAVLHRPVLGAAGLNTVITIYSSRTGAPIAGFALAAAFGTLVHLESIRDQTGDGRRDLAFFTYLGAVLIIDGVTLVQHSAVPTSRTITDVLQADVNGDGIADYCTVENGAGGVSDYFVVRDGVDLAVTLHDIAIADRGHSLIHGVGIDHLGLPNRAFLVTYDGEVTVHDLDLSTNTRVRDAQVGLQSISGVVVPDYEGDGYDNIVLIDANKALHMSMRWGLPLYESFTPPSAASRPEVVQVGESGASVLLAFSNPNDDEEVFSVPGFSQVGVWHRAFWEQSSWESEQHQCLGDAGDGVYRSLEYETPYSSSGSIRLLAAGVDSDLDRLSDYAEGILGTVAADQDSDDDGLRDDAENFHRDTEVTAGELDPRDLDTDQDLLQDGTESGLTAGIAGHTSVAVFIPDSDPASTTNPLVADTDGGGVLDGYEDENINGRRDTLETNPNSASDDRVPGSLVISQSNVQNSQYGIVQFTIDFLDRFAGTPYQVLGAFSAGPGLQFGAVVLPLRLDPVLVATVRGQYPSFLVNFRGLLNANGDAVALMTLTPGDLSGVVGRTFHWTCVQWDHSVPNNLTNVETLQVLP